MASRTKAREVTMGKEGDGEEETEKGHSRERREKNSFSLFRYYHSTNTGTM